MATSSNYLFITADLLKKVLIFSAFFYAFFSQNLWATACPPPYISESARVNQVYDGDTLQLEDGRRIRLIGIDTPELYSKKYQIPAEIRQAGEKARQFLRQKLQQVGMRVSLAHGNQQYDRYERNLAHAFLPDGENLQALLIQQGHAIAFTTPPNDRLTSCYRQLEQTAQQANKGIWQLDQYQLMQAKQLTDDNNGFHRLQGKVTRIWQTRRRLVFMLDERVEVYIHKDDLAYFSLPILQQLQGKHVTVRGWLRPVPRTGNFSARRPPPMQFKLMLRHQDSLVVQK